MNPASDTSQATLHPSAGEPVAGHLYVVSTPIGNLGDISARARHILEGVDLVAAEDTRRAGELFHHLGLRRPAMAPYYDEVEQKTAPQIVARLQEGQSVALISDAGTPTLADPGYRLVRAARAAGIEVHPIPGASSLLALLAVAGLPTDRFSFLGFLPSKGKKRQEALEEALARPETTVLLEAPHRLHDLLDLLAAHAPEREVVVGRELTKRFETLYNGTAAALAADPPNPRGEIVVALAPAPVAASENSDEVDHILTLLLAEGLSVSAASRVTQQLTGAPKKRVYPLALALAGQLLTENP